MSVTAANATAMLQDLKRRDQPTSRDLVLAASRLTEMRLKLKPAAAVCREK
jgi:hypothetical protein